jgi:hypothetical protein
MTKLVLLLILIDYVLTPQNEKATQTLPIKDVGFLEIQL